MQVLPKSSSDHSFVPSVQDHEDIEPPWWGNDPLGLVWKDYGNLSINLPLQESQAPLKRKEIYMERDTYSVTLALGFLWAPKGFGKKLKDFETSLQFQYVESNGLSHGWCSTLIPSPTSDKDHCLQSILTCK